MRQINKNFFIIIHTQKLSIQIHIQNMDSIEIEARSKGLIVNQEYGDVILAIASKDKLYVSTRRYPISNYELVLKSVYIYLNSIKMAVQTFTDVSTLIDSIIWMGDNYEPKLYESIRFTNAHQQRHKLFKLYDAIITGRSRVDAVESWDDTKTVNDITGYVEFPYLTILYDIAKVKIIVKLGHVSDHHMPFEMSNLSTF